MYEWFACHFESFKFVIRNMLRRRPVTLESRGVLSTSVLKLRSILRIPASSHKRRHFLVAVRKPFFLSVCCGALLSARQPPIPNPPSPAAPLTLEECIKRAMEAPSAVVAARQSLEASRYGVKGAVSAFLPKTVVNNGFTLNSGLGPASRGDTPFISLNGTHEYQTLINSSVELDTSGRLRADLAKARSERDIAQVDLRLQTRDLRQQVTLAYLQALLTRHLRDSARESLDEAQRFEQLAEKLFNGGEVAQADVVKAQAQAAFSQQLLEQGELDARLANQQLASFWTTDVDQTLGLADVLSGEPNAPPGNRMMQTTVAPAVYLKRPELLRFDAEHRGALADYHHSRADLFPTFTASYEYGIDAPIYSWSYRGQAVFLALNVPIFDFFHTRDTYKQLQIRAQIVDTNRHIAERQYSREYQSALARVESRLAQVKSSREQVRLSESNLRLAKVRYEGGEGTALDVVAAVQQAVQSKVNYFTAYANYFSADADLKVAEGQ
jgi:outer membrane protein